MTDYAILLKNSGLKATFQRMNILEVIEKSGHLAIETIYNKVVQVHSSLSLATIYKNILLMVEKGVLVEVPIAGEKPKYEVAKIDHIHLVCSECGCVEDKPHSSSVDDIFKGMTNRENFALNKQQITLYGVCASCQELIDS